MTDLTCYYRFDGRDDRPPLVLVHSLGLDHTMWDEQVLDLAQHFLVLRIDVRGHGLSTSTPGEYTIDQLSRDVIAVMDAAGIHRAAYCGLSLGGMIGQWIAVNAPERISQLVLANTTPRMADPSLMETRRRAVLDGGMAAVVDTAMSRFFSQELIALNPPRIAKARRTFLATSPIGYAGCCAALRDMDQRETIHAIQTPTLVISGDHDVSMPWPDHGGRLSRSIPGSRAVQLATAHISNLEMPRSFVRAVLEFLLPPSPVSADEAQRIRRSVLGDAHVDRAQATTTDFTRAFQSFLTSTAWGTIWSRPGLDHRTRRLLVLTTTAALGRWEEFRMHVRTGLAARLEPANLEETLLQLAVYAGVPAANTAFHIAAEEIRRADPEHTPHAD